MCAQAAFVHGRLAAFRFTRKSAHFTKDCKAVAEVLPCAVDAKQSAAKAVERIPAGESCNRPRSLLCIPLAWACPMSWGD